MCLHQALKIHLQAGVWQCFWEGQGVVPVDFMPRGHNMNADFVHYLIDYD